MQPSFIVVLQNSLHKLHIQSFTDRQGTNIYHIIYIICIAGHIYDGQVTRRRNAEKQPPGAETSGSDAGLKRIRNWSEMCGTMR